MPDDASEPVYGAIARAEALVAGHPTWWEVTKWPLDEPPDEPPADDGDRAS